MHAIWNHIKINLKHKSKKKILIKDPRLKQSLVLILNFEEFKCTEHTWRNTVHVDSLKGN